MMMGFMLDTEADGSAEIVLKGAWTRWLLLRSP